MFAMDALLQDFPILFQDFPPSIYGVKFDNSIVPVHPNLDFPNDFPNLEHIENAQRSFVPNSPDSSVSSDPSAGTTSDGHPFDNIPYANCTLRYINEMLMDEDLEEKTCMLQDCLALQAAERSFYEVLGQKYPPSPSHLPPCSSQNIDNPDVNPGKCRLSLAELESPHTQTSLVDSSGRTPMAPGLKGLQQPLGGCQRGTEGTNSSIVNGDSVIFNPQSSSQAPLDSDGRYPSPSGLRGRKNYQREDGGYLEEGRRNKQSAISPDDSEPAEMFDEVLLCKGENDGSSTRSFYMKLQQNNLIKEPNTNTNRKKKQGKKRELVDLWTLLTQCAQAVAINDQRTARDLVKQIRQHSLPSGDGTQRLAHYFSIGLETRIAGMGAPLYSPLINNRTSAADILKAYRLFVLACPFKKMSNLYANRTIIKVAERATCLHIIDFGIAYGFQWPCLIQRLSARTGGAPKLRITGIELPQPGFRPTERVEETMRRLKRYCERFEVPFEYSVIAKKWETIQLEDLKIDKNEQIIVNSLYRLRNLPDDTVAPISARDTVLNLIKKINPAVFIHGVVNGTYNAPFFVTRFREALFHFSALFDIFEANAHRHDQQRLLLEKEIFGRDIMNVIACEGAERVERPETYKQWQARNSRAGFRQVPLDQEIVKNVKNLVSSSYHRDFVVDVDGHWLLQGWKGRVIHALSCWEPVRS